MMEYDSEVVISAAQDLMRQRLELKIEQHLARVVEGSPEVD